jgi:hypothetical protein
MSELFEPNIDWEAVGRSLYETFVARGKSDTGERKE